jgi:hypothetical protein
MLRCQNCRIDLNCFDKHTQIFISRLLDVSIFSLEAMSTIPPSASLVRLENPVLITAQHEKDRKGVGTHKMAGVDQQHMMDMTGAGASSPQSGRKQAPMKDLTADDIFDRILPAR